MFEGRGNGPMQNSVQKMKRNANILTSSVDNFVSWKDRTVDYCVACHNTNQDEARIKVNFNERPQMNNYGTRHQSLVS